MKIFLVGKSAEGKSNHQQATYNRIATFSCSSSGKANNKQIGF
jgi:hypothetical protein